MQRLAGFFKSVIQSSSDCDSDQYKPEITENAQKPVDICKGDDSVSTPKPDNGDIVDNEELKLLGETVYDIIKDIQDPEKPQTLEELNVVSEDSVTVQCFNGDEFLVKIVFVPTVPHCSLASLIGLCMRQKVIRDLPEKHKLDIYIKEGTHETADEINKQINDKERIAAAMENPNLKDLVNKCIDDEGHYR